MEPLFPTPTMPLRHVCANGYNLPKGELINTLKRLRTKSSRIEHASASSGRQAGLGAFRRVRAERDPDLCRRGFT
jgi:hypothetical protein